MNQSKTFRILELIWLTIAIAGVILAVYSALQKDTGQIVYFLAMTVIAGIMYALRRKQRISASQNTNSNNLSDKKGN